LIKGPEKEIVKKIKETKDKDEEVIKAVEEMKKAGVKVLRNEEWQIEEGLVLKEGRVYVLRLQEVDFFSFYFSFSFLFYFYLFFIFSIFRILRVGVRSDWLHCHICHSLMVWSQH